MNKQHTYNKTRTQKHNTSEVLVDVARYKLIHKHKHNTSRRSARVATPNNHNNDDNDNNANNNDNDNNNENHDNNDDNGNADSNNTHTTCNIRDINDDDIT